MIGLIRKPLFWTNLAVLVFAGWLIAGLVFGFNNPGQPPPNGSGAIQVDGSGNVGVGGVPTADRFSVSGNVSWTGSLTGGGVPWARLTSLPANCPAGQMYNSLTGTCVNPIWNSIIGKPPGCPAGQYVTQVGATLGCTSLPASGGNVSTPGGTIGTIPKFTGATSIGNSAITDNGAGTITVSGNIVVTGNTWGAASAPQGTSDNSAGNAWARLNTAWTIQCPSGYFVYGIGQNTNGAGQHYPVVYCAQL